MKDNMIWDPTLGDPALGDPALGDSAFGDPPLGDLPKIKSWDLENQNTDDINENANNDQEA